MMEEKLTMRLLVVVVVVVFAPLAASAADNGTISSEARFQALEKGLKANVGKVIKMLLPHLLRGSTDANVSGQCQASVMKTIGGLRNLREWAVRFIDASGKIPPAILDGTSLSIGDYDECLDIVVGRRDEPPRTPEEITMTGQYCMLELHGTDALDAAREEFVTNPDAPIAKTKTFLNLFVKYNHLANTTFKMGVCVPSKCTAEDLENIANAESIREHLGKVSVLYCKEKGNETILTEQKVLLCLFGLWTGCMTIGTILDAYQRIKRKGENEKSEKMDTVKFIIRKTSLYSNAIEALSARDASDPLACLRGLRVVIIGIVMYSHTYAHLHKLHFQKFSKPANFLKFFDSFTFAGIGNGSVTLDSLYFLIGLAIAFKRWRYVSKNEQVKLNVLKFFSSRFARMGAGQLLMICIFLMMPLFGSGPFWNAYLDPVLENCRQRWWLNILLISNYWKPSDLCIYNTWIVSLSMQLYIVGFIILWIMKRSVACAVLLMALLTIGGIIGVAVMTVIHELPGALAFFMLDMKSFPIAWKDVFQMPFDHFGPLCIGILTGYFLAIKKEELKISKVILTLLWCCSSAVCLSVMFGLYRYRNGESMDFTAKVFYAVLHRNVWCIGIAWLVIACATHHGGPLSRVLKAKVFIPLDRVTFLTYLIHMPIIFFHSGTLRTLLYMGHMDVFMLGVSYISISYGVAFILYTMFAIPYFAIEEYVSSYFKPKYKLRFRSQADAKAPSFPSGMTMDLEAADLKKGCVNVGYSKKLDS